MSPFRRSIINNLTVWSLFLLLFNRVDAQSGVDIQSPLQPSVVTIADNSTSCHQACILLQVTLGQSAQYLTPTAEFKERYFAAQQRELDPVCVVLPESVDQVSQVINVLKEQQCPFTIRSGGHGNHAGTSSIQDGLVVDLSKLNGIEVSEDESTVFLGAGNRWRDVYSVLEERGLTTTGGRAGTVGVGGFTLGGGISFLSRRYGWALDNVRNFEVVLANGTIANVNQNTHPDLYFALRGGGSNFGIVTRFDFEAYRYGGLAWGGMYAFNLADLEERRASLGLRDQFQWTFESIAIKLTSLLQRVLCRVGFGTKSTDVIDAFVNLASEDQTDKSAHAYIYILWHPLPRAYLAGSTIVYSQPEVNPPVFHNITSLPRLFTTQRLKNLSDFTDELDSFSVSGLRQSWDTATFKMNATLISKLWDVFISEAESIKTIPGTLATINLQLLTKDEIALFRKNGGNSLGIAEEDGPLFFFSITTTYENSSDDEVINLVTQKVMSRAIALGKEMGLYHPFIYQNYAGPGRDVFAGYGAQNRERLLKIQQHYDPEGVFSRLQPGYYKV